MEQLLSLRRERTVTQQDVFLDHQTARGAGGFCQQSREIHSSSIGCLWVVCNIFGCLSTDKGREHCAVHEIVVLILAATETRSMYPVRHPPPPPPPPSVFTN